jgi:hypothetical protein
MKSFEIDDTDGINIIELNQGSDAMVNRKQGPAISDRSPLVNYNEFNDQDGVTHEFIDVVEAPRSGLLSHFLSDLSDSIMHHIGSIGYLGSFSLAVNSLTGPAMLNLPDTFQRSGIIPTIFTLVFVAVLSAFCCLHISNTISKVSDNSNFRKEVCKSVLQSVLSNPSKLKSHLQSRFE